MRVSRYIILIFVMSCSLASYSQSAFYQLAKSYADSGNYSEAIRLMKQCADMERHSDFYIDDIALIARYYSFTNEKDSLIYYNSQLQDLAKKFVNVNDSIAEEYIQSSAWNLYEGGEYELALNAAKHVLSLRESIYGIKSLEYLEWLGVISHAAFKYGDYQTMSKYIDCEIDVAEKYYGLKSKQYEDVISSIRGFAHAISDHEPEFVSQWILPYYDKLIENRLLPHYQYEYEIILLASNIQSGNLREADKYAQCLKKWTYSNEQIPLKDKVRIYLKLAYYNNRIGDTVGARFHIEEGWKLLDANNQQPDLAQLIDRHIIERELKMDSLGRRVMNAEWLIQTSLPIIEDNMEDSSVIAFFHESLAWAYESLKDYPKAILNIKRAIELNPLVSRRQKLAHLYMSIKDYEQAEQELLDMYAEVQLPGPIRRSIESDMTALYWLSNQRSKLESLLTTDFENMKSEVRSAFVFLNESEREEFLEKSLLGSTIYFDQYTGYSNGSDQWPAGNEMAYNLALVQKGLLLSTTRDIVSILQDSPDSIKAKNAEYEQFRTLIDSPFSVESELLREKRIELMQYVSKHPQFLSQLNTTWKDVRNKLNDSEAAIEFINLWGISPENMDNENPSLGALILRKDADFPVFVRLGSDSTVTNLYEYDDEGTKLCELLYSGGVSKLLYNIIWEPLLPYLSNIETIYYAPTGVLQDINWDWININDADVLSDKYNLYRVSSTRNICKYKNDQPYQDATLYGDIAYSIKTSPLPESEKSKYRSSTRAGFSPLKGTAKELDSISYRLYLSGVKSMDLRKDHASEETFYKLSGHSPKIIHIATHGFYYSREAIEDEYKLGNFNNFIAYQGMNHNELYHSGLAFSGAQDTWYNEMDNVSKYIEMDASNDGILLSSEISKLDLSNTDIVILSACETALGNVKSEGVYGLQRAFKLAGVNSIIMSLWKVDDDATQLLMTAFYQNYLNGMSKREALLAAQKEVKKTPGFEDPYNWAAFVLLDGLN